MCVCLCEGEREDSVDECEVCTQALGIDKQIANSNFGVTQDEQLKIAPKRDEDLPDSDRAVVILMCGVGCVCEQIWSLT